MARPIYLGFIFIFSTIWLFILSYMAPTVSEVKKESVRFPTSFSDLKGLSELFTAYYQNNTMYMMVLFSNAYLYKQSFCIPGSALLNILGGAIFGFWIGLPICCFLTGLGATCSYMLSKTFAEKIVVSFWPQEINYLKQQIERNEDGLTTYLLSLRLLPLTPNWLLNLISPIVGIPLHSFFFTAFFGLVPYNYICVQAGAILSNISSFEEVFTWRIFTQLTLLAIAAFIIPKLIKYKVKKSTSEKIS